MTASDLPDLRRLAMAGAITYSSHALDQMLNRDIRTTDVEEILRSESNQLIEVQSASTTPGKQHRDPRNLIYDPDHNPEAIIVLVLLNSPSAEIRVITVEKPDEDTWIRIPNNNPALVRKN